MGFQQPVQPRGLGPQLQQVLESIVTSVRQVLRVPLLDGRLIKGVVLPPAASTKVTHGLGRRPLGWLVISTTGTGVITEPSQGTRTDQTLVLYSVSAATVDLWVF